MRTPGRLTSLYALLVDKFHLTLPQIYELTPRQIQDIYLHPRDDQGCLKMPTPAPQHVGPRDDRDRLALFHRLSAMLATGFAKASPESRAKLAARIAELETQLNGDAHRNPAGPDSP